MEQKEIVGQIPEIYFNGFSISLTSGDISLVLQRNGRPVAVLNSSFTVTKELGEKIDTLITLLERNIESKIHTTSDIAKIINEEIKGKPHDDL